MDSNAAALAESLMEQKHSAAPATFFSAPVEDQAASLEQGKWVGSDVDFVTLKSQGGTDDVTYKVKSWFRIKEIEVQGGRFPRTWLEQYKAEYAAYKNKQEIPLVGTPIRGWGMISPAQQEMLISLNIRTVEDLSKIGDEAQRRIGMGSLAMKNKAIAWLSQLKDKGPATQEIAALKQDNLNQSTQIETLLKQVAELTAIVKANQSNVPPPPPPERPAPLSEAGLGLSDANGDI